MYLNVLFSVLFCILISKNDIYTHSLVFPGHRHTHGQRTCQSDRVTKWNSNYQNIGLMSVNSQSNNDCISVNHNSEKDQKKNKKNWFKSSLKTALLTVGLGFSSGIAPIPMESIPIANAADTVKVGKCLLNNCQKELAQCILNPKCFANVICLNTCNGRSDEGECQIKCGDTFENDVVGVFNNCAVSQKKCVPQKQDEGEWPLPAAASMVKSFDTSIWNGRWYITAGLNKAFDIFDCQVHFFTSPSKGKFYAKLFWRVNEPDGEFFTKDAVQRFIQDPKKIQLIKSIMTTNIYTTKMIGIS